MSDDVKATGRQGLSELAEDAVGFGGQELRLTRDLLLRPRSVMDAYDAHGPTAGGLYPRPVRYYLAIMGLYLLVIAMLGGFERIFEQQGPEMRQTWAVLAERTGKSLPEFLADLDQWYSVVSVPVTAVFFGGVAFLLIRRWNTGDDRQDFRQTFTYLNAYSVLAIPVGLLPLAYSPATSYTLPVTLALMALTYARVGGRRWWRTPAGAWGKGALLLLANLVVLLPAGALLILLAVAGAYYLP